jgi:membrane-associated protease RseP (regulator of RpoE activity)
MKLLQIPTGPGMGLLLASAALIFVPLVAEAQPTPPPPPKEPPTKFNFVWKTSQRGFLGVQVMDMTPELRRHFGAPEDMGVLVSRVDEDGPAAAAGILVGDILTKVDGEGVPNTRSLAAAIRKKKDGETVAIDALRDGSPTSFSVSVEERDRPLIDLAEFPELAELPEIGGPRGRAGHGVFLAGPRIHLDDEAVEALEEAMHDIEQRFDSEEWQERLRKLQEIDLGKIEERMKEVEERLRNLENELDQESKKKF